MKRHQLKSYVKTEVEHSFNPQSRKIAQNKDEKEKENKKNIQHKTYQLKSCTKREVEEILQS